MTDIAAALKSERLAAYARLRGGFPIPLAGAVYWGALGVAGGFLTLDQWILVAFIGTGAIFPLALVFAALFRNGFMKDRTAVAGVIAPAFIGMLLFWPIAIAAWWTAPALTPLALAVGLAGHWPVIGWSYGRTALYSAHAVVRAAACFYLWRIFPDATTTLLPYAVSAIYLVTVAAIYIDSGLVKARLEKA